MDALVSKFKEVLYAVLPITIIVLILNFTLTPLDTPLIIRFIIGAVLIVIGLAIFLFGVDLGITPIGNAMGSAIARSNKISLVVCLGLLLGFFISVAEPDLHILAGQVDTVTGGAITKNILVGVVSVGIAVMISVGLVRIVYNIPLYKVLTVLYAIILILAVFTSQEFLAIAFDASGATTGALTVPFILALAMGISVLKKDSKASEEDSFGLVAVASTGAIIAVMIMSILTKTEGLTGSLKNHEIFSTSIMGTFFQTIPTVAGEVCVALSPIVLIFVVFQKLSFKLRRRPFRRILMGLLFTFVGLVLFLTGVNAGFMDVGATVGHNIASLDNKAYIIIVGFILGLVTILAEPAVHVLRHQIEDVTSGYVRGNIVMLTLAIGVGFAVALSILRILIPGIELWHYLLPGYLISIIMAHFVPKLFVGIAFDSGGVASGPMTATFILAFAQGAAESIEGASVLSEGFGMIAMVALTPLIALQILGFIFKIKSRKGGLEEDGDEV